MRLIRRALAFFRSEAKTKGVSPKVLAPVIAAGIAYAVREVGLSPEEIGAFLHVGAQTVLAGQLVVAATIAGWLLGPGSVAPVDPDLGVGSDAAMGPAARATLD